MLKEIQLKYKKVTFRQILWRIFFVFATFINSTIIHGQNSPKLDYSNFDKQQWLTSSSYRYEIVKSEKFPALENLTRRQIIRLLGPPSFKSKKAVTYCLDIPTEKDSGCEGSSLTIYLDKKLPPKYRVLIIWVERSRKKD